MKKELDWKIPRNDHLDDYAKLSPEQILEWLQETNQFFNEFKIDKTEVNRKQ